MAEPGNSPDRAAMKRILLPAAAVAAVLVVVAILWSMSGAGPTMSDGSDGSESDPGLTAAVPGVKYRDLRVGDGKEVEPGATVKVKYKGWLTDGLVFDSSSGYETSLNAVVRGWAEGIPGMKVGGTRKLVIAPEMGYGGVPNGKIPADSTLIFEVTVLEVKPPPPGVRPKRDVPMTLIDGTNPTDTDANLIEVRPGLKYRDLKVGSGEPARENATVVIEYTGWLMNGGKAFDSSFPKSTALQSPLVKLIAGWQIGVPGMKPGGIRKLVVGPELAYKNDKLDGIPPGSTLVFQIELIQATGP